MVHSLMVGASKLGMDFAIASPEGYDPDQEVIQNSKENAAQYGGSVLLTRDPREAIENADIVYTDVWASMGFEAEQQQRRLRSKLSNQRRSCEICEIGLLVHALLACTPRGRSERGRH